MKILLYPRNLNVGGSPINAIDLGAAIRDLGHEVVVFGRPGPLMQYIAHRRLRFIPAGTAQRSRPGPGTIRRLSEVVRLEGADLVHTYENRTCVEAFYAARLLRGVPVVATVLAMAVPRYLPRTVPLIVGTRQIQEDVRRFRPGTVELIEPPVDVDEDDPSVDGSTFVADHGLGDGRLNIVVVSRITPLLKLEGLERTVDAVAWLARERPVRLVIVGWGPSSDHLRRRVDAVNDTLGCRAIAMLGPMMDPRPAYATADVVVGMGSSILRGMAFAKPAVVVGEDGFSEIVSPATIARFYRDGFYGLGDGDLSPEQLYRQLKALVDDEAYRRELASFSREVVCQRFSLGVAGKRLEEIYRRVLDSPVRRRIVLQDAFATAGRVIRHIAEDGLPVAAGAMPGLAHDGRHDRARRADASLGAPACTRPGDRSSAS